MEFFTRNVVRLVNIFPYGHYQELLKLVLLGTSSDMLKPVHLGPPHQLSHCLLDLFKLIHYVTHIYRQAGSWISTERSSYLTADCTHRTKINLLLSALTA